MVLTLASYAEDPDPSLSPDQQALAVLTAYLFNGGRISSLCKQLNVSRWLLMRWIGGDKERHQAFLHARTQGADALVDEGGDLLDGATRDTIAVANARAGWRKWLASKYDPVTYGEGAQATTPSALHLHYHAALSGLVPPPLSSPPASILLSPPSDGSHAGGVERGYPTERGVEIGTKPPLDPSVG